MPTAFLIADAAVDLDRGQWISSFQFYLLLMLNMVALVKLFFPQRRTVAMEGEFTQRRDFEAHTAGNHKDHENLFSKMGGIERGLRSEIKADTEKLRDKIDGVAREVSEGNAMTEQLMAQQAALSAQIQRVIERGPK